MEVPGVYSCMEMTMINLPLDKFIGGVKKGLLVLGCLGILALLMLKL
jgi:hypothetical protein